MNFRESINDNPKGFLSLCKSYDVKTLYVFGSSINETFDDEKSDIDLLIEIATKDPIERGENLIKLWDKFELFFQREVDLLTTSSLKNPFLKKSIESSKLLIYDGQKQEVSF